MRDNVDTIIDKNNQGPRPIFLPPKALTNHKKHDSASEDEADGGDETDDGARHTSSGSLT